MKSLFLAGALLVGFSGLAQASYMQSTTLPGGPYTSPHATAASTFTNEGLTMSMSGVYRSPFDGTTASGSLFTSVQSNGVGIFDISGFNLSLIWGSPDSYNNLTLYTGAGGTGTAIETINGASIAPADGTGFSFVQIHETTGFASVVLSNTPNINAFEVSTFVSSVPLPASLPMFGGALLALAGFSYGMNRWVAPKSTKVAAAA